MECQSRLQPALGLGFAEHVHRNALADVQLGSDAVDRLLHFAVAPVAAFDGVGCRRKQRIIEERQGLAHVRRKQLLQRSSQRLEPGDPLSQPGQFGQSGIRSAPAVEEAIDLVHDFPQISKGWQAAGDPPQGLAFGGGQVVLDKKMTVLEQVGDFLFEAFLAGGQLTVGRRRPAPAEFRQRRFELAADLGHGLEDVFVQFGDHVELADLMRGPDRRPWRWPPDTAANRRW